MIIIESKRKKAAIEREQNKACLGYAECEQARLYVKPATILKKTIVCHGDRYCFKNQTFGMKSELF